MGWTSHSRWNSPRTREEERAEIVRLHTTLIDTAPYTAECLMACKVGSTWYAAIRLTREPGREIAGPVMSGYVPDERGAITYAGVVLTDRRDGEWGYKSMCESMAPRRRRRRSSSCRCSRRSIPRRIATRRAGVTAWLPITPRAAGG